MGASIGLLLGTTIHRVRQYDGLSQSEIAQRAGISQAALSYIESGRRTMSLGTLSRIASALGTSVSELVKIMEDALNLDDLILERALETLNKQEGWISFEDAEKQLELPGESSWRKA